ncbi:MAG: hypothetical protein ACT4O0_04180 [Pseudonocardia sp.]
MQAKLENSVAGRALITVLLLVTLAAMAVPNLPESRTRSALMPVAKPYLNATGLNQSWGVFSPNPRNLSIYVDGQVESADGTITTWTTPHSVWLGAYRDYRWHKFSEYLRLDEHDELWQPFAAYLGDHVRAQGHDPVRTTLTRRWSMSLPPGPGPDREPQQAFTYFDSEIGPIR